MSARRALVLPIAVLSAMAVSYVVMVPRGEGPGSIVGSEESSGGLALPFIQNLGQAEPGIAFLRPGEPAVAFSGSGLDLAVHGDRVGLSFVDGRTATPRGLSPSETVVSYFRGDRSDWVTGVPTFGGLEYPEVWPGIDVRYTAAPGAMKYEFLVAPGADPSAVRMAYEGATSLEVTSGGALRVDMGAGALIDHAPVARQPGGHPVAVEYDVAGTSYGFDLGPYDPSLPLVIDPAIVYSGFIGGSDLDRGYAVAVDATGSAYVTGETDSADFPATTLDTSVANRDGFVAKVTPDGSGFEYVALIGGGEDDFAWGIAVDGAGRAVITGSTDSPDFPTDVGPDTTFNEPGPDLSVDRDAYVSRLNAAGTDLEFSGYLGGSLDDTGDVLALDAAGNVYVTGDTDSSNFPASGGPDSSYNGSQDAFIAKVLADGSGLAWSGFIGGTDFEYGQGVSVDGAGNVAIVGQTGSSDLGAVGGPDTTLGGASDGFVGKLKPDGSGFTFLGYVGGSADEDMYGAALDRTGAIYTGGLTESSDFPAVVGPDTTFNGPPGDEDGFVAKIRPDGSGFAYAGFIGGSENDDAWWVDVDGRGSAYMIGETDSSDFPVVDGPDLSFNEPGPNGTSESDAFVAKVLPNGTGLVYSSFLGGGEDEYAFGLDVDAGGNAYVTGATRSSDFPAAIGPDLTFNSTGTEFDAFVTKVATTERCKGRAVTLLSTTGNDRVKGTSGKDVILDPGGNDRIAAGGGKDLVCAGKGNDKVKGQGGTDRLFGEGGKDLLVGGSGRNDVCQGGPGRDRVKTCEKGRP